MTSLKKKDEFEFFKFRAIGKHFVESLVTPQLWFSTPQNLNDPFDCQINLEKSFRLAEAQTNDKQRTPIQKILSNPECFRDWDARIQEVGICSFSSNLLNTTMWAHYADEHRGACVLYRIPSEFLSAPKNRIIGTTSVVYQDNRLIEWLKTDSLIDEDGELSKDLLKISLTSKSPDWASESELRIIRMEPGFLNIPPQFIQQVCFGLRTSTEDIRLIKSLAKDYCGCQIFVKIVRDEHSDFGLRVIEI